MAGGNIIDYPGDMSTPNDETTTSKIMCNSVVSTPKGKFMRIFIFKKLGCNTNQVLVPPHTHHLNSRKNICQYNFLPLVINGFVYLDIFNCMYGLPQDARL